METTYAMVVESASDEQGRYYGAYFPDLPGCGTTGRTLKELRCNVREALQVPPAALRATGQPVPKPTARIESITVKAS